jgi:hypothetical protein
VHVSRSGGVECLPFANILLAIKGIKEPRHFTKDQSIQGSELPTRTVKSQSQPSGKKHLANLMSVVLGLVAIVGFAIELYVFEYANPTIAVYSPGTASPLTLRVKNNSYIDFFDVRTICHFDLATIGGIQFTDVEISRLGGMNTPRLGAGSSKLTSCSITGNAPLTAADLSLRMTFKIRCLPFLAICNRSTVNRFRLISSSSGPQWIEGQPF